MVFTARHNLVENPECISINHVQAGEVPFQEKLSAYGNGAPRMLEKITIVAESVWRAKIYAIDILVINALPLPRVWFFSERKTFLN
jgi:hypothetical protein